MPLSAADPNGSDTNGGGGAKVVDLREVSLARLLFALLNQRFTGRMALSQPAPRRGNRSLRFVGGIPISFDWDAEGTRLGELLLADGALTKPDLDKALVGQSGTDMRIGEVLREAGNIDPDMIANALAAQCSLRLVEAFSVRDGKVELHGDDIESHGYQQIHVLATICRGVQEHYTTRRIVDEMGDEASGRVWATADFARYREHFQFPAANRHTLDALSSEGVDLDELAVAPGSERLLPLQIVFTLWACQMLGRADVHGKAEVSDVQRLDDVLGALEARIRSGAKPHELLNIDEDADTQTIENAWAFLTRRFDPDELPPDAPEGLRTRLLQIRAALADVRGSARERRVMLAELAADRLLAERKFPKALPLYEEVAAGAPDNIHVAVHLAWCRFQVSDERSQGQCRRVLEALKGVLEADESFAEAYYYRGFVLMELDRRPAALEAFDKAARLNPKLVDAERQARALRTAARGGPADKAKKPDPGLPKFLPKPAKVTKTKHPLLRGFWPLIWLFTAVALAGMIAAQVTLRMDVDWGF